MWIIIKACLAAWITLTLFWFIFFFGRAVYEGFKILRAVREIRSYDIDRIVKKTGVGKKRVELVVAHYKKKGIIK